MKKILSILFCFLSVLSFGQGYNPTKHIVVNDGLFPAQKVPLNGRTMYFDSLLFVYRDFQSTAEVLANMSTPVARFGHTPIAVHLGGTLNPDGSYTGGTSFLYWFRNGVADSNLVKLFIDSVAVPKTIAYVKRLTDSTFYGARTDSTRDTVLIRGTAAGGISSLSMAAPSIFTTPVTFSNTGGVWSGTLSLITQGANTIFAGPTSGGPGNPTFRSLVVADMPTGIPNSNLQNSSIGLGAIGTSGTAPNWGASSVSLGGTATLNIPIASGINTGIVTPGFVNFWNSKVDSTQLAATQDSVFDWRNAVKYFRYKLPVSLSNFSMNNVGVQGAATYNSTNGQFNVPIYSADSTGITGFATNYQNGLKVTNVITSKGDLIAGTGSGNYSRLGIGTNNSVLTADNTQSTGLRWQLLPTTFNIFNYGAFGDGLVFTDGAVAVSTNILVSNQATFTAGDVGKVIFVKRIGVGGRDTLTTITGFTDAHHITIGANASVGTSGIVFKYGHDDTPAFQAAIQAAYINRGGTIQVPGLNAHGYMIAGPLIHSDNRGRDPNSQIWFPSQNFPENNDTVPIVIRIQGEYPPTTEFGALDNDSSQLYNNGSMLWSVYTGEYGKGSVFGTAYGVNTGFGLFSALTPMIENLFIMVPDGPFGTTRSGVDFFQAQGMYLKNNVAKADLPAKQTRAPQFHTFGFRATAVNGGTQIQFDGLNTACSFESGFVLSEHATGLEIQATACRYGILFTSSSHINHISTAKIQWCSNMIYADNNIYSTPMGPAFLQIDQLDVEGLISGFWYDYLHTINDSLSLMHGTVGFHFVNSGLSSPSTSYNIIGGRNMRVSPEGNILLSDSILLGGGINTLTNGGPISSGWPAGFSGQTVATIANYRATTTSNNSARLVLATSQGGTNALLGETLFGNINNSLLLAGIQATTSSTVSSGILYLDATKPGGSLAIGLTLDGNTVTSAWPIVAPAGTTTTGSLQIPAGTLLTTPVNGNIENNGTHLFYTAGGTRFQLDQQPSVNISNSDLTMASGGHTLTVTSANPLKINGQPTLVPITTTQALVKATDSSIQELPLSSATYTATLTNTTNITSSTFQSGSYHRIGNIVHISVGGLITPTSGSANSVLTISLPISTSNTTQTSVGNGFYAGNANQSIGGIVSVNAASTVTFTFTTQATIGSGNFNVEFDYQL